MKLLELITTSEVIILLYNENNTDPNILSYEDILHGSASQHYSRIGGLHKQDLEGGVSQLIYIGQEYYGLDLVSKTRDIVDQI